MEYMQGLENLYINEDTAVTIGKFDGVHRGHQKLVKRILELEHRDCRSVIVTLNKNSTGMLLTDSEKREILKRTGVSFLIDCPFVPEIVQMSPEVFVREILVRKLHARYIIVGEDFRFGYERQGDCNTLMELQKKYGFCLEVIKKEQYQGNDISSSYIKQELKKGNMKLVNTLLGYPYFVSGEVLHGRKIGRTLGMPTTNLIPTTNKLLPPNGVYVSNTFIGKECFYGVTNIGCKPTIGEAFRGIETYIFDFDKDLYGETIEIQLLEFKRREMKFHSLDKLKEQMHKDISLGREYFNE